MYTNRARRDTPLREEAFQFQGECTSRRAAVQSLPGRSRFKVLRPAGSEISRNLRRSRRVRRGEGLELAF